MNEVKSDYTTSIRKKLEDKLTDLEIDLTKNLVISRSCKFLLDVNKKYDNTKSLLINNQSILKRDASETYKYIDLKREFISPIIISNNTTYSLKNEEHYFFSKDI